MWGIDQVSRGTGRDQQDARLARLPQTSRTCSRLRSMVDMTSEAWRKANGVYQPDYLVTVRRDVSPERCTQ